MRLIQMWWLITDKLLDGRRIQHYSNGRANCLGVQIFGKFSTNNTIRPMASRHLSPHYPKFGTSLGNLCFVNKCNFLAKVIFARICIINTVNFQQRCVVVRISSSSVSIQEKNGRLEKGHPRSVIVENKPTFCTPELFP